MMDPFQKSGVPQGEPDKFLRGYHRFRAVRSPCANHPVFDGRILLLKIH